MELVSARQRRIAVWTLFLALGIGIGFVAGWFIALQRIPGMRGSVVRLGGYDLISPLLACDIGKEEVFNELTFIRNNVQSTISEEKSSGRAISISVYMRLLNSSRWLEINGSEKYTPASLLKVFVMMGFLKKAESDPSLLSRRFVFAGPSSGDSVHLGVGISYRIDNLIREMIVNSNNDALHLLLSVVDVTAFDGIYKDLNISVPPVQDEERLNIMDPVSYSMVFRVLYGATYLNREMSERGLQLLSESVDTGGLAAQLPTGTRVAHKFGLRRNDRSVELHDCGIIYYPEHPYLLCVMTRGTHDGDLSDVISRISKVAYDGVDTLFKR
jgi:beta-lactamase class A